MNFKTIYFFGFTLFKLILKRIFLRKDQEKLLRSEFLKEGIFSIEEKERKMYHEFSRCINCGFCAVDIPENSTYFQHPEIVFNSLTTNLTDVTLVNEKLIELKEFHCPVGAPYIEIKNFIESRRTQPKST